MLGMQININFRLSSTYLGEVSFLLSKSLISKFQSQRQRFFSYFAKFSGTKNKTKPTLFINQVLRVDSVEIL